MMERTVGLEQAREERGRVSQVWLEAMAQVVRKTGDSQGNAVHQFVKSNGVLSRPLSEGAQLLESPKGQSYFMLVPLIPGDETISPYWAQKATGHGAVAYFLPDKKVIVLRSNISFSPIWTGIVGLHEGNHARVFLTRPYAWQDPKIYSYKEKDTHTFQNQLARKLGGKMYKSILEEEVRRLLEGIGKKRIGEVFLSRTEYNPLLDEAFGPAQSDVERNFRQTSTWIDANFELIDRLYKGNKEDRKAKLLHTLYQDAGILPQA